MNRIQELQSKYGNIRNYNQLVPRSIEEIAEDIDEKLDLIVNPPKMITTDDIIYYNVIIPHNPQDLELPTLAFFTETRTLPIIRNQENYFMAVIRFQVPGTEIPITVAQIQPGQTQSDPDLTVYQICLTYKNVDYPATVKYIPIDRSLVIIPPSENPPYYTQVESNYYYIYSYQDFVHMLNLALQTATNDLNTANSTTFSSPYFMYNTTTQLFSLIVPYNFISGSDVITIYMNDKLFRYYEGLSVDFWGYNLPNGKDFSFIVRQYSGNSNAYAQPGDTDYGNPTNPPTYLIFTQQYSSISYWNSFRDIVFTTNIGISGEAIPSNSAIFNQVSNSGTANYRLIITDYQPSLPAAGDARSQLQFYAQGPWRLINLTGQGNLETFNMGVFWSDQYNFLRPLYIADGQAVDVKIAFVKKSLYKSTIEH